MNHIFRVVWNASLNLWQAVAENCKANGKAKSKKKIKCFMGILPLALAGSSAFAASALPSGGTVVAGNGAISQNGNNMTINQTSGKMAIDWQSFSIGQGNSVNFIQPSASAVALNRVIGSDVSLIQGSLTANGQVFLINPNGVLFSPTAQVNVGGLVTSTLNISNAEFLAGNYKFQGSSSNAVVNQGRITVTNGGTIALIAAKIVNEGNLTAQAGNVLLGAGSQVVLDLGGPVKIQVQQAALHALISNGGAIKADGGLIYLSAQAANALTTTVINNTGLIEAQTLATGEKGKISLMGGMANDRISVGGTLDASAPNGGDGGFIETSAYKVSFTPGFSITTKAVNGRNGSWLIDPYDFTIAASGGDITGADLATALNSNDVTISTSAGSATCTGATCGNGNASGNGDINVNDAVTWSNASTLTLSAHNNINVNANITEQSGNGGVIFKYGQSSLDGGTSAYNLANSATVTANSIQWKKGSDPAGIRYAIVNGDVFLGGEYIELGINSAGYFGGYGGSNIPSLFYGRQGGNSGIGMTGAANGFASSVPSGPGNSGGANDLRIDYFLPGSPFENTSVGYNGATKGAANYCCTQDANSNNIPFQSVNVQLLPLGADNVMKAKITEITADGLKIEQIISLGVRNKYFTSDVTLTNTGASALANVVYAKNFDPDNTVDIGGDYATNQKIDMTKAAGDGATIISATSVLPDAYSAVSGGKPATIFFYTKDSRATVGFDTASNNSPFWGADVGAMATAAASQQKGDSINNFDGAMGMLFNLGSLNAGASANLSMQTVLAMGTVSDVTSQLGLASSVPVVATPPSIPPVAAVTQAQTTASNTPSTTASTIPNTSTSGSGLPMLGLGSAAGTIGFLGSSGGLTFVSVPQAENAGNGGGGQSSVSASGSNPPINTQNGGLDPVGVMRVLVVNGGISLPDTADSARVGQNNPTSN